jgi:hypothetical protein
MKHRVAVVMPWLGAVVAVVIFVTLVPQDRAYGRMWNAIIKSAATVGAILAYAAYQRGDYMRRAWFFLGLSYLALATRDLLAVADVLGNDFISLNYGQILSNLFSTLSFIDFARAFRVAGLEIPGSRGGKTVTVIVCVGLGLGLAGYALVSDIRQYGHGVYPFVGSLFSDVGDMIGLALLAPIFLTALGLRGGLLGRPWLLLTAAQICWLVYDVGATGNWVLVREAARTLACLHTLSAGLAQRWLLESSTHEAAAAARVA